MSKPSFQFYPGDWRKDANLRRCSPAARGVWMDILCVMHDSEEYGVLRWPLKDVAQAAGAAMAHVRELVDKGVLRGHDKHVTQTYVHAPRSGRKLGDPVLLVGEQQGPMWYSARMVKDNHVRTVRGEGSRFGDGNGDAPNASPKGGFGECIDVGQGDGSSSSSSTSVNNTPNPSPGFAEFWSTYPRKDGKANASKAWGKLKPDDELQATILAAIAVQRQSDQWRRDGGKYVPHASTWLNGQRWEDGCTAGSSPQGAFEGVL